MNNVLVTGTHRSGSTWVGHVLCSGGQLYYIHEPFNIDYQKQLNFPFKYWFEHISYDSSEELQLEAYNYIRKFIQIDFDIIKQELARRKQFRKKLITAKNYFRDRLITKNYLIKDPIALFSAEWLHVNFDLKVLILIRHPAAFALSIKDKNWNFPFDHITSQPKFFEKLPSYLQEEILNIRNSNNPSIIDQAILFWNISHHIIWKYMDEYKGRWLFIKHEEISSDPQDVFKEIFNELNLKYNSEAEKYIINTTQSNNSTKLHRDSKSNVNKWKFALSKEEIENIYIKTCDIAEKFYGEQDWKI